MRKVILSMQITLDGFVAGLNNELDWIDFDDEKQWDDLDDLVGSADTFLLGGGMYAEYADYWRKVLANPASKKGEMDFARIADKTPHIVFSKSLSKADWANTTIEKRNVSTVIPILKKEPGKDIVVWGGAA